MIILIATGHNEKGICDSNELYNIIERISPDVIFEEVPPNKFDALYKGLINPSLEVKAIMKYLQKNPIDHFPVDMNRDDLTEEFYVSDFNFMSNIFIYHSAEYRDLSIEWNHQPAQSGFPYLNRQQCEKLLERKLFLEGELVQSINHKILTDRYFEWRKFNHNRENEMLKNIYSYCSQKKYENALFLVGAEHRWPLIEKISRIEKENELKLDWNFNYFRF